MMAEKSLSAIRCKDHHKACACREWEFEELERKSSLVRRELEKFKNSDRFKKQEKTIKELSAKLEERESLIGSAKSLAKELNGWVVNKDRIQFILKNKIISLTDLFDE